MSCQARRPPACRFVAALALLAALLVSRPTAAEELYGRVVRVVDGDTIALLDAGRVEHRLRLSMIDAPEKAQPFGARAKQALSDMCFGKQAKAVIGERDRYGRGVATVTCERTDANEAMVGQGMAWVFRRYVPAGSRLYQAEQEARQARRGLWVDASPVPPWEWRRDVRGGARP